MPLALFSLLIAAAALQSSAIKANPQPSDSAPAKHPTSLATPPNAVQPQLGDDAPAKLPVSSPPAASVGAATGEAASGRHPATPPNEVQPQLGDNATAEVPVSSLPAASKGAVTGKAASGHHPIDFLLDQDGHVEEFSNCSQACDRCFRDNYQTCIAHCRVGCRDHCDEVLPKKQCKSDEKPKEVWVAEIGSIFDLLMEPGQLCQTNAPDVCMEKPPKNRPPNPDTWSHQKPKGDKREK